MRVPTSSSPVSRETQVHKKRWDIAKETIEHTHPRIEYKNRRNQMGSENDAKVDRRVPDDRPGDSRDPERFPGRRQLGLVSPYHDDGKSAEIEGQR